MSAETVRVHLDTHRTVTFGVGWPIIARGRTRTPFSAIVAAVDGVYVDLTFTPREAPRRISMNDIVSAGRSKVQDLAAVPEFQMESADV